MNHESINKCRFLYNLNFPFIYYYKDLFLFRSLNITFLFTIFYLLYELYKNLHDEVYLQIIAINLRDSSEREVNYFASNFISYSYITKYVITYSDCHQMTLYPMLTILHSRTLLCSYPHLGVLLGLIDIASCAKVEYIENTHIFYNREKLRRPG